MIRAVVKLKSTTPYSQSKLITTPRAERETPDVHERRVWRERMHTTSDGFVEIPPMGFKHALFEAAKRLGIKIPGERNKNYTKSFEAGIMVVDSLVLPYKAAEVEGEWLFVPSDGKKGGGSRVSKCFPKIPKWEGTVEFLVLDEIIPKEVFQRVLDHAGSLVGIGRFRPANGGYYGRFNGEIVSWEKC